MKIETRTLRIINFQFAGLFQPLTKHQKQTYKKEIHNFTF
jgi:hypothetical protein